MGDDVAPTSLNEGRGEVVPALMAVSHLSLKRCLVDGWAGDGTRGWANDPPISGSMPNAERRKGAILGRGAQIRFPLVSLLLLCRGQAVLQR